MLSLKTEGEHVKRYIREFHAETFRVMSEMPTKEWYAHRYLKEYLDWLHGRIHFRYSLEWESPTCLKCGSLLSKKSESSNLICFMCGAEYELKEQVK